MKYIVGASIGGLFGFGMPLYIDVNNIDNDEVPRQEESQPVEEELPTPIDNSLILPDNTCRYISYDSDDIKEQVKECLSYSLPAMPAI
tara:strand:- start:689 stop:952 length:264 start_codon:yes stop_codon:yes gene_type:complete